MDIPASPTVATGRAGPPADHSSDPAVPDPEVGVTARAGAWVVLLGTMITTVGLSWDIQWHVEVGPDTFFTLSHLALYSGSALSGIASLVMVLMATSAQRADRSLPRAVGGTPVRVLGGRFAAPLGYLISGIGAASFLLYGLLDLWWHSLYGFDAVLNSPPHVALFLSISITMVGSIVVFAAARDQRWAQIGLLIAIPILITFAPVTTNAFSNLSLPIDPTIAGIIFFSAVLLVTGAGIMRRPGAAVGIAAVLGVLQAFLWWFSPWAAHTYAAAVGLPLRDGLTPKPPELPGTMPMFLIVAAVAVEVLFWLTRDRNLSAKIAFLLAGGAAGLVVAATLPLQQVLTDPTASVGPTTIALLAILGIALGSLAGFLSGRFTTMLRAVAPATMEA
ncbi:hypothetical protein ACTXG6_32915 [Pseudonocardia sp. Cha107L01]|uniref:hypothetical protein n=1 Tax=Pseudonocardia sp. Cha107L01 TaxID=3457576 RepID=UPI00403EADBF